MAIPWLFALRAVPWGTILANAPSILRAADALSSKAHVQPDTVSATNVQAMADRIAALEHRNRETAELISQLTAQLTALTTAGEVLEARARWLLVIAIGTSVMSVLACGIALLTR